MAPSQNELRLARRTVLAAAVPAIAALKGGRRALAKPSRTVRFAFFGTPEEQTAYDRLVDAFVEANPDIAIELIGKPSGDPSLANRANTSVSPYQPWLQLAFVEDNPPDVFMLSYQRFGEYAARGVVEPLDPYLRASTVLNEDDFYSATLDAFRYRGFADGGLGALPQNASSLVVYYNKDLFDILNVRYPTDDWTWDEFASTAAALTVDTDGDGRINLHGLAIDPSMSRYAAFVWGAGADFIDDPDLPTKLDLDSDAAQSALTFLTSLGQTGLKVTPTAAETRQENDLNRFCRSKAAMLVHTRRVVPTLRQVTHFSWDVAPLPLGKVAANVLHSDGFCMSANAADKDAAWRFIEYVIGPEGQAILAASGRTVPSLRSVAESDAFLKGTAIDGLLGIDLPPANSRVFLDNARIARRLPATASWLNVEQTFNTAFRHAFYVDGDVAAAVQQATASSRNLLGAFQHIPYNLMREPKVESEE